jgi:hypothetical protein
MKKGQKTNGYMSLSEIAILTMVIIISIFLLIGIQFPLKALAENSSNANLTAKTAGQSAESLIRSIIDPQSIISSIVNKTSNTPTTNTAIDNIKNATSKPTSNNKNITLAKQSSDNSLAVTKKNNKETDIQSSIPALRQSAILMLAHQIIPPKDFIPLYDSSLDKIAYAHISAKIPCNGNSSSTLELLAGHTPNIKPVKLEPVKELSKPGYLCMYHTDIGSTHNSSGDRINNTTITNVLLHNPSDYRITLPNTSTIIIDVNQIVPLDTIQNQESKKRTN